MFIIFLHYLARSRSTDPRMEGVLWWTPTALSKCFVSVGSIAEVQGSKCHVTLPAGGLLVKSSVKYMYVSNKINNRLKTAKLPAAGTFCKGCTLHFQGGNEN